MLLRGSSNRSRGQQTNRSRAASRGRGSTSRGASSSSSKFKHRTSILLASKAILLKDTSNASHGGSRGRLHKNDYSNFKRTGTTPTTNPPDPFEQERIENSAKREQRGQNGTTANGRGAREKARGFSIKKVRFEEAAAESTAAPSKLPSPAPSNPFVVKSTTSIFGSPAPASFNPFAPKSSAASTISSANANPFGPHLQSPSTTGVFGAPSMPLMNGTSSAAFITPSLSVFGGSSTPNVWGQSGSATTQTNNTFGTPISAHSSLTTPTSSSFGTPSKSTPPVQSGTLFSTPRTYSAPSAYPLPTAKLNITTPALVSNRLSRRKALHKPSNALRPNISSTTTSGTTLAGRIEMLLRKEGVIAPSWPTSTPGDPRQKAAVEAFWQTSKGYRSKVRTALIRAGYLDDPDKPKKLSEAIDFKGTCEEMCPEFEKITRIVEHDVQNAEKEPGPDGSLWPAPAKMVKALARSAAGQDAPLPMDVRSPAALRRTLDYLFNEILGDEDNLSSVHGFLWDRTRAIRRDFVFQSSMTPSELEDQVYCLEQITSFHVIALHLMSRQDVTVEDFSEQQEIEQLGKALLSLMHAYEDCQIQGVECLNEWEFRAYYVLFNAHNPGILETVQDWGWKFWGTSDEIQSAVKLVEALQNIWDARGPLKPHSATDVAQNAFSRFFSIVEDKGISYTMACFAEIHFNSVRKAALQTIVISYRKQRDQTRDWNLTSLNAYLRFDDEQDIISFCETHGMHFDDVDGEEYLSFESEDQIADPFPPNKQRYSYRLVERKRCGYPLQHVIDCSVWEEDEVQNNQGSDGLFVEEDSTISEPQLFGGSSLPSAAADKDRSSAGITQSVLGIEPQPTPGKDSSITPRSLFDRISAPPPTLGGTPFFRTATKTPEPVEQGTSRSQVSPFAPTQPTNTAHTIFTFPSTKPEMTAPLSFFNNKVPNAPATETRAVAEGFKWRPSDATQVEVLPLAPLLKPPFEPLPPLSVANDPKPPCQLESQSSPPKPSSSSLVASNSLQTGPPSFTPPRIAQVPSSPLQHISATIGGTAQYEVAQNAKLQSPIEPRNRLAGVSKWVALGDDGLVDQFMAFTVEDILTRTYKEFMEEQFGRATKAAEELARREADHFRYRSLATKYCYLWREAAHRKWLRRRGKEARQARKEMAEELRASRLSLSTDIVEDLKNSTVAHRRSSLESLLAVTGVLNGVHDPAEAIQSVTRSEPLVREHKRHKSDRSTRSPALSSNSHAGAKLENSLRRSLLSDPSYLDGRSRMHLLSTYGAEEENCRHSSGVQTDYFRLKARGITTLPSGSPLASSVAKDTVHHTSSLDGTSQTLSRRPLKSESSTKGVRSNSSMPSRSLVSGFSYEEDARLSKSGAKAVARSGKELVQKQKRGLEADDEELFERAKRIREQMDEGLEWYRKEIEMDATTKSVS